MKKKINKNSDYSLAHVLYQKLGNDWYAFTEMDGDCFMTKVDAKQIEEKKLANFENSHSENLPTRKRQNAA